MEPWSQTQPSLWEDFGLRWHLGLNLSASVVLLKFLLHVPFFCSTLAFRIWEGSQCGVEVRVSNQTWRSNPHTVVMSKASPTIRKNKGITSGSTDWQAKATAPLATPLAVPLWSKLCVPHSLASTHKHNQPVAIGDAMLSCWECWCTIQLPSQSASEHGKGSHCVIYLN